MKENGIYKYNDMGYNTYNLENGTLLFYDSRDGDLLFFSILENDDMDIVCLGLEEIIYVESYKEYNLKKLKNMIIEKCNYYYGVKGVIGEYGEWYYDDEMGFTCDNAHWTYCTRKLRPRFGGIKMVNLDNCPLDLAYNITRFFKEQQ